MTKPKYTMYATTEYGNGRVQQMGTFDDIEDITIEIGMFARDVVITIEENYEKPKED